MTRAKAKRPPSSPLCVLHLIEDLDQGGAERVLVNLVSGLNPRRFTPLVCCLRHKGVLAAELEARRIPVIALQKKAGIDPGLLGRLQQLLRSHRVTVLHAHVFTANFWGRLAALLAGVPVRISHEHSTFTVDDRLRRGIERVLAPHTSRIVAVSEQLRRRLLAECCLPAEKVVTIHNGLRLPLVTNRQRQNELVAEFGLERFSPLLGAVGRLEVRKNFPLLLQAMTRVRQEFPRAGLLLVGAGPEAEPLQQQAARLGLREHVIFAGQRRQAHELLPLLTVFCLPSQTEGISMALLEAMAAGVPVVATAVGGNPEIIPQPRYGLLVPAGDHQALATALLETLRDRSTARARAQAAQKFVQQHFTETAMIRKVEELYLQALARR
ncbi:MAG: glycosyltransferase [candidate division KSB1 bacterium]|nr:glycosyltransferase [candidate division KSB1 bacterium]MDZ7273634.1 glycosyltransferase [candidate division KSB1 bacterium]MDZ7286775.1 glycosyltransferase [candidate division KSB1 bacterium]MDZ7299868.1 glycosyltransferase [candidate division KSB1 bacterium]MDZ7305805.1 glycosyltransferase [candidate division KSB1 bacterium]